MPRKRAIIVRQIADLVIELLETRPEPQTIVQVTEAPPPAAGFQAMVFSLNDAAKHLGTSRANLYRLMDTGQLPSIKVGSRRLIERRELERFIAISRVTKSKSR